MKPFYLAAGMGFIILAGLVYLGTWFIIFPLILPEGRYPIILASRRQDAAAAGTTGDFFVGPSRRDRAFVDRQWFYRRRAAHLGCAVADAVRRASFGNDAGGFRRLSRSCERQS